MAGPPRRRDSPPALPDELVEEILLRLPPDDPSCLLRASLGCKAWSRAVSDPGFRRRLHALHRTPPMLGFLHNWEDTRIPRFVSTIASAFSLATPDLRSWKALDFRHGRALFLYEGKGALDLLVWEPMTGYQRRVPLPAAACKSDYPNAAVVCAADGCDHRDCHGGPFRVVLVFDAPFIPEYDPDHEEVLSACAYSSETGRWGELTSIHLGVFMDFIYNSSVLVEETLLYFMSDGGMIVEYDLARHGLIVFDTPGFHGDRCNLMLTEDGGLGVTQVLEEEPCICLWSREASEGNGARWVQSRVIYLEILPLIGESRVSVLGFAKGVNAIFVNTDAGLFTIELQSEWVRKVCERRSCCRLIPIVSFYTPAPREEHHDPQPANPSEVFGGEEGAGEDEKTVDRAQQLFDKGSKAIQEGDFVNAVDCLTHALEIMVQRYGELAPECAGTYYKYGCALLYKAHDVTNPSGIVPKSAPNEESVKSTTSKDDTGNSKASGQNSNGKYLEDGNMAGSEDDSDLDLAWKMLDIARAIVEKSPDNTMEKVNILSALAEVSIEREDIDNSLDYYFKALAILERLVGPDHCRIVELNFRICLVFELASKIGDAIPHCAKASSLCKSRIQNLKNAMEALLTDKDGNASTAEGGSEKSTLEDEIEFLTGILAELETKLEELEQAISTQALAYLRLRVASQASSEQSVSNVVPRGASLASSEMAESNNYFDALRMSTAATTGSTGSAALDLGVVGEGIK